MSIQKWYNIGGRYDDTSKRGHAYCNQMINVIKLYLKAHGLATDELMVTFDHSYDRLFMWIKSE